MPRYTSTIAYCPQTGRHEVAIIDHNVPVLPKWPKVFFRPDYSSLDARLTCNWLNGREQALTEMQSERDDPLIGQHRKA